MYDLINKKIINKLKIKFEEEYYVPLMLMSDYMYIVKTNGGNYDLYIWDYKKDVTSENMVSYSNSKDKMLITIYDDYIE